ncbi:MAG: DEAD/DEAH box helicase [Parachlamydia sp.]|nr:DEAD/DEAH box helicase [Parachlamydia sp.]
MSLPSILMPFKEDAERFIAEGRIRDIEFSGSTYQVQVADEKEEAWAFLQLDSRGQLKDCLCSCEEFDEKNACAHVAAAWLRIYGDRPTPIHQRFERSLWNKLCRLYADRLGDSPRLITEGREAFFIPSASGKTVFSLHGKNAKVSARLKALFKQRVEETEETSLKFSNLSQDELLLWREGRPSPQLRYELSYWSDLAKWFLRLEDEGKPYKIEFEYSHRQLPNRIVIEFPDFKAGFYLSEANLPLIVPALGMVQSPLKVHDAPQDAIQEMRYDKGKGVLIIVPSKIEAHERASVKEGIPLDGWRFVPGDGFYASNHIDLLAEGTLQGRQISELLDDHLSLVKSVLEGTTLHEDPVQVSYAIAFDREWNLHISGYLFNPGDLSAPPSRCFGNWAYLDDEGFYHLEGLRFPDIETLVPAEDVADFIQQNRAWLNTQEGFQTHLASVEAEIRYQVSEDDRLTFSKRVALAEEEAATKEFGPWVYISGQGFYARRISSLSLPIHPGVTLGPDQIPLFIHMHREELQLVPGFFSAFCPVVKAQLNIELDQDEGVNVTPVYDVHPDYREKTLRFFGDFVHVAGEGFHELPSETKLPERFRHPLHIERENVPLFLTYELVTLRRNAARIDPRLIKPEKLHLMALNISKAETGGYLLKLRYETERGAIPITSLWQAHKEGKRFVFDEAGLLDLDEKRFNWLRLMSKAHVDRRSHTVELSTLELVRLNAFEEIQIQKGKSGDYATSKKLLDELLQFRIPAEPDISGLKSNLRPYQVLGVRWLWFLYSHGLSGLLCDDMGLGKTHQTMALIAAIQNQKKEKGRHYLIVCPTSVIYHWQEKLEAFLPHMRVCTFHGSSRSLKDFHQSYDILLTSYGIWRNECEMLSEVKFELAVFDEIQVAKSHLSRIYAALLNADAKMRLGLTGTPIENRLRELKSLFDIVLPTYMPDEQDYREQFIKPIEKESSAQQRYLLARLVKPFVLRRKKEDVLLDLPEKVEEIAHCEMLTEQEALYLTVLSQAKQKILEELQDEKNPIPYVHIFALLSSLKQICNHPAAYLKKPEQYHDYQSGKWELFVELLTEARESQQKVVVFSHYLAMLDIIEMYLQETGVGFATIRGSTVNRAEQLHRFNHDPDCEVFVASLHAAGLGIDLTAGSVVIHYDRWWNAARENQATDRVHRIGQMRGVQVFKLVTKNTFEEKIDTLIARKAKLMEEVVTADDHRFLKSFDRQEIMQLFQYVSTP